MVTANKTFDFELITPDGLILESKCVNLVARTDIGEIGILANHADLTTKLTHAPLRFENEKKETHLAAVLGGVLEVKNNKVIVISDYAEKDIDINELEAKQAKEEAETELKLLSEKASTDDVQFNLAEARLKKELLKLQTLSLKKQFN